MLSDLLPLGLTGAAARLGLEPFELVRLLVATDAMPRDLRFTTEQVDGLFARAALEQPWWDGVDLPEDKNPLRQRVRAALGLLLGKGFVGGEGTRIDNVCRGLPSEDQALIRDALVALADEGHLTLVPGRMGVRVTVTPASEGRVRDIAAGKSDTSALSVLYEG